MTRALRPRQPAVMGALALALFAAACAQPPSTEARWSKSAAAPDSFTVAEGSASIPLPSSLSAFANYMAAAGSDGHFVTGEGEGRLMSPPEPRAGSPCAVTDRSASFVFPIEGKFMPKYVAYLSADGMVICVDKQFQYASV
jgi:hypothetical protein